MQEHYYTKQCFCLSLGSMQDISSTIYRFIVVLVLGPELRHYYILYIVFVSSWLIARTVLAQSKTFYSYGWALLAILVLGSLLRQALSFRT